MSTSSPPTNSPAAPAPVIVVQNGTGLLGRLWNWFLYTVLSFSILCNVALLTAFAEYFAEDDAPTEKYYQGEKTASAKLAIIDVSGTIMSPLSDRVIKAIKHARDDDAVKGVLVNVDSPGGLVTDSHQIYHRLKELAAKKPVVVAMKSLAASGGYYLAMGAGPEARIFAEPTTWTGSIGVIIPHYEAQELAEKVGIKAAPLKTGPYKDALSPFRPLAPDEVALWENIMGQSFDMFLTVIDENRKNLDRDQVKKLATGQIYTAKDALANGLIDAIGYEEDALAELKTRAGVDKPRIVKYKHQANLWDSLSGLSQARSQPDPWHALLDASVPRPMYLFSWGLPAVSPR